MPKHFITGYSLIVDSSTVYHLIELVTLFERKSNVPVIGKVLALDSSFIDLVPPKVSSKLHVVCYFFTANCVPKNPIDKVSARRMKHQFEFYFLQSDPTKTGKSVIQ